LTHFWDIIFDASMQLRLAYFENRFLIVSTMVWSAHSQNGTYTLYRLYTLSFTNLGVYLLTKMMNETRLITGTPSLKPVANPSRHGFMSHATPCGTTRSAMSHTTFSNTAVYTSRATSCGVTQLLVAPQSLRWVLFNF
jgi:hypothetical protein